MKSKNLVLTISVGDYYNKISQYTLPSIEEYADKINADFINLTDTNSDFITQKWNKFEIYKLLNTYNRIIYFDIDILIRKDTPNLFELVPETKLGMFNEGRYSLRGEFVKQASEYYNEPIKEWNGKFYNSGVMVISRRHKQIFALPKGVDFVPTDQPYINLRIINDKVDMFDLDYRFNRMDILDKFIGITRHDSYIIHYAGAPQDMIFDVIGNDIKKWEEDYPRFEYKRNILIRVSAGMGDQLCSEPVIRHVKEMYSDSNIYVVTHFPRLFDHLDLPVYTYDEWKGINDSIIIMDTCPDEKSADHSLSHVLFHPVDFASISMIRKTIPNHEKQIKLRLDISDTRNIIDIVNSKNIQKELVLVHAGKWWPSKTFPKDWWQTVVNGLSERLTVGLIGKTIDENQGYVPIECPENGIDFRDITTLGELFSLISLSKVTLTNDSSPLHIAGAFDNWIVTIPTCKHPDHILPYRNGTQYYKTKVLYNKLLLDDLQTKHTEFYTDTIDTIPEGMTLYDYLPDPQQVINEIFEIYYGEG